MADKTTIEVSTDTWERLNRRKSPGESFDDVISGMLGGQEAEA